MRNSVKTLIVGVVLVEVAFGAYLLTPKSDSDSPDSTVNRAYGTDADEIDSGDSHMITGNIERAPLHVGLGNGDSSANGAATSTPSIAGMVASAAPLSGGAKRQPPQEPTVQQLARAAESHKADERAPADTAAMAAVDPKANVEQVTPGSPRIPMTRDSARRHSNNPVAAAMTDQLVKESAKLDPNLPPPDPSFRPPADTTMVAPVPRKSTNPVGDAMTAELVRQSSRLDPNLPPPEPASAR